MINYSLVVCIIISCLFQSTAGWMAHNCDFCSDRSSISSSINCRSSRYPTTTTTRTTTTGSSTRLFGVDKLRQETGIRPSLHPTTINALTEAIKQRAASSSASSNNNYNNKLRISESNPPVEVAMEAGRIAADFLAQRRLASSKSDDGDDMVFTDAEEQTIAGRVVAVVMRMDDLGDLLHQKACAAAWVPKYDEWASFGVLQDAAAIDERIRNDPLFAMTRAECLLAIYLKTVEGPRLAELGEKVPGGSTIDFLDADRIEVLLGDFE